MNKKLLALGVAVATGTVALASSASAFWGGDMTAEKFEEFKTMVSQSVDFESFRETMKSRHEGMKAEREAFQESITRSVENIDNGVIQTLTSEDPEVVTKLQSREDREPQGPHAEDISRVVENISNGIKITLTSDDAEIVERIQNRAENPNMGKGGHGKQKLGRRGNGEGREFGKGGRFGKFQDSENQE
ncbi:hypothetical protein HC823_01365 [Candidatus Gracilibacteria bacterium]|nr:hypothetical protein [Candidatus Gracilibacteria bacterium]